MTREFEDDASMLHAPTTRTSRFAACLLVLVVHASNVGGACAEPKQPRADIAEPDKAAAEKQPVKKRRIAKGSSSPSAVARDADPRSSQRAVCQSQCNLERMTCDQGRAQAFRDRSDQIQAKSSSCYLAVNSCLSRC